MPEVKIGIPSEFFDSVKKFTGKIEECVKLSSKVQASLSRAQAAAGQAQQKQQQVRQPVMFAGMNFASVFSRFQSALNRFENIILMSNEKMFRTISPSGRGFIQQLSRFTEFMDVSGLIESSALISRFARIGAFFGGPVGFAVGVVASLGVIFLKWVWNKIQQFYDFMYRDELKSLSSRASVGGIRAIRTYLSEIPGTSELIDTIGRLRQDPYSEQARLLYKFFQIKQTADTTQMTMELLVKAQAYIKSLPQNYESIVSPLLLSVFSQQQIVVLREMSEERLTEQIGKAKRARPGLQPRPGTQQTWLTLGRHVQTAADSIVTKLGEWLARSGFVAVLTRWVNNTSKEVAAISDFIVWARTSNVSKSFPNTMKKIWEYLVDTSIQQSKEVFKNLKKTWEGLFSIIKKFLGVIQTVINTLLDIVGPSTAQAHGFLDAPAPSVGYGAPGAPGTGGPFRTPGAHRTPALAPLGPKAPGVTRGPRETTGPVTTTAPSGPGPFKSNVPRGAPTAQQPRGTMPKGGIRRYTGPGHPRIHEAPAVPSQGPTPSAPQGPAGSTTTEREAYAIRYFESKGWSHEAALGFVTSLRGETSSLNINQVHDHGNGYGIAGWDRTRQDNFRRLFGHDMRQSTLDEQLEFYHMELSGKGDPGMKRAGDYARQSGATAGQVSETVTRLGERPRNAPAKARERGSDPWINDTRRRNDAYRRSHPDGAPPPPPPAQQPAQAPIQQDPQRGNRGLPPLSPQTQQQPNPATTQRPNAATQYPTGGTGLVDPVTASGIGGGVVGTGRATRAQGGHQGIDLLAPANSPIYAAGGGVIESHHANATNQGDAVTIIKLDDGRRVVYMHHHLDPNLKAGARVEAGQQIGRSGVANNTPHLHYEIWEGPRLRSRNITMGYPWNKKNLPVGGRPVGDTSRTPSTAQQPTAPQAPATTWPWPGTQPAQPARPVQPAQPSAPAAQPQPGSSAPVLAPHPSSPEATSQTYTGDTQEVTEARAYLLSTMHERGGTVQAQGDANAIARLHPEFALRLARGIKDLRAQGYPDAGLNSAYRTGSGPTGTGSKFDRAGESFHSLGAAVDIGGIGGAGSKQTAKAHQILAGEGVVGPYGPNNRSEYNHFQLVPGRHVHELPTADTRVVQQLAGNRLPTDQELHEKLWPMTGVPFPTGSSVPSTNQQPTASPTTTSTPQGGTTWAWPGTQPAVPGAPAAGPAAGIGGNRDVTYTPTPVVRDAAGRVHPAARAPNPDYAQNGIGTLSTLRQERSQFTQELQDPETRRLLAASTEAEVSGQGTEAEHVYIESVLNRAASRHTTIANTLRNRGYYPPTTINKLNRSVPADRQARIDNLTTQVMSGSNVGDFTTGNESGTVRSGNAPITRDFGPRRERFIQENDDRDWVRHQQEAAAQAPQQPVQPTQPQAGQPGTAGAQPSTVQPTPTATDVFTRRWPQDTTRAIIIPPGAPAPAGAPGPSVQKPTPAPAASTAGDTIVFMHGLTPHYGKGAQSIAGVEESMRQYAASKGKKLEILPAYGQDKRKQIVQLNQRLAQGGVSEVVGFSQGGFNIKNSGAQKNFPNIQYTIIGADSATDGRDKNFPGVDHMDLPGELAKRAEAEKQPAPPSTPSSVTDTKPVTSPNTWQFPDQKTMPPDIQQKPSEPKPSSSYDPYKHYNPTTLLGMKQNPRVQDVSDEFFKNHPELGGRGSIYGHTEWNQKEGRYVITLDYAFMKKRNIPPEQILKHELGHVGSDTIMTERTGRRQSKDDDVEEIRQRLSDDEMLKALPSLAMHSKKYRTERAEVNTFLDIYKEHPERLKGVAGHHQEGSHYKEGEEFKKDIDKAAKEKLSGDKKSSGKLDTKSGADEKSKIKVDDNQTPVKPKDEHADLGGSLKGGLKVDNRTDYVATVDTA